MTYLQTVDQMSFSSLIALLHESEYEPTFEPLAYEPLVTTPSSGFYPKDERKYRIKFIDALDKLFRWNRFQIAIHTKIKDEAKAHRLCDFYTELAKKESHSSHDASRGNYSHDISRSNYSSNLFCYVDYVNLEHPMDIKHYEIRMCNWNNEDKIRNVVMRRVVHDTLNSDSQIILYKSHSKDFLIRLMNVVKDLKIFTIRTNKRYFIQYGPSKPFYVLYIDTTDNVRLTV